MRELQNEEISPSSKGWAEAGGAGTGLQKGPRGAAPLATRAAGVESIMLCIFSVECMPG